MSRLLKPIRTPASDQTDLFELSAQDERLIRSGLRLLGRAAPLAVADARRMKLLMACFRDAAPSPGTCRVCGCVDALACPGGCSWADAENTLCSACVPKTRRAKR